MASGGWTQDQGDSLRLPPDGSFPAIDINPEVPAVLSLPLITFDAVQIFYFDATSFYFQAVGTIIGIPVFISGTYDPVNGTVIWNLINKQSLIMTLGSSVNTAQLQYVVLKTDVEINTATGAGSTLAVTDFQGTPRLISGSYCCYPHTASAGGTTTSATFVDVPGAPSKNFSKAYGASGLALRITSDFFCSGLTGVEFALEFDDGVTAVDVAVGAGFVNPTTTHIPVMGLDDSAAGQFDAGDYVVTMRWRRYVGAGTATQDANSYNSFEVFEVSN